MSFPVWEIVWANGRLYDLCDAHAGGPASWPIEDRGDGALQPVEVDAVKRPQRSATATT